MAFFKRSRHRIVSCDDAKKRVLLTGGINMVCPEDADIQETLEDDTDEQQPVKPKQQKEDK